MYHVFTSFHPVAPSNATVDATDTAHTARTAQVNAAFAQADTQYEAMVTTLAAQISAAEVIGGAASGSISVADRADKEARMWTAVYDDLESRADGRIAGLH